MIERSWDRGEGRDAAREGFETVGNADQPLVHARRTFDVRAVGNQAGDPEGSTEQPARKRQGRGHNSRAPAAAM